jgi:general L-amino acid transport system permease protein
MKPDQSSVSSSPAAPTFLDYFRDLRVIRVIAQIVFVAIIVVALGIIWSNILATLTSRNLLPSFDFLQRRAGFAIAQSPAWYSSDSTYGEAFRVGVENTIQVVTYGLVGATFLGIFLGIALLSSNWLIKTISRVVVEILRNTPLLVQLIFWYFIVWLSLPENDISFPQEQVFIFWLRYIVYLVVLLGVWAYSANTSTAPRHIVTGVFVGIILAEIIFAVAGTSVGVIIALGIAGAAALYAGLRTSTLSERVIGTLLGVGILALAQLVGHGMLDIFFRIGWLMHPQFLYGEVLPAFILSRTGFITPRAVPTVNFPILLAALGIGLVAGYALFRYLRSITDRTGRAIPRGLYAFLTVVAFVLIGWVIANSQPVPESVTIGEGEDAEVLPLEQVREEELLSPTELQRYEQPPIVVMNPERNRFGRVLAGINLSPSYMAVLIALVVYTAAFIGEIVRAGIQAVPYGQIEAARAVGLSSPQTLRMIILPQALRVIIPPMGNQYLNLSKNSSLATFVAYADTYQVGQTIMNQSGQSITGFFLILLVYLTMSLLISLVMNLVNSRFQLVTR